MIDADEKLQNYILGKNHIKRTLKVRFATITLLYGGKKSTELCANEPGTFMSSFICAFVVFYDSFYGY